MLERHDTEFSRSEGDSMARGQGKLVLVADDNPVFRLLLARYFLGLGMQSDLASNGEEALSLAIASGYSLIVMDLFMPRTDGLTATRAIRAHERDRGIRPVPILIVSASGESDIGRECLAAGATAYLRKPTSFAALQATLTAAGLLPALPAGGGKDKNSF